jgi:hypothetical protein
VIREVIRLPTPADLSQESYLAAKALFGGGELPLMLIAAREELNPLVMWLWENHRVTSVLAVPAEILKHPNAWALVGHRRAVVCEGF